MNKAVSTSAVNWSGWAESLGAVAGELAQSSLLLIAAGAVALGVLGSIIGRFVPFLGRLTKGLSTLVLVGVLLLIIFQTSRFDPRFDGVVPAAFLPKQEVVGTETHLEMAKDGHFWVRAEVNGHPVNFLIDTGASVTALSTETAAAAGVAPRPGGLPVQMMTANGPAVAELASLEELRFGNVVARGMDVIIAPNLGNTNVIGMNFLSRLKSWRVEGRTMVLVPNNPQPVADQSDNG